MTRRCCPVPTRYAERKVRRRCLIDCSRTDHDLVSRYRFVHVQDGPRDAGPGSQFDRIGYVDLDEIVRRSTIASASAGFAVVMLSLLEQQSLPTTASSNGHPARGKPPVSNPLANRSLTPIRRVTAASATAIAIAASIIDGSFSSHQCLQRRVGAGTLGRALLATGRVHRLEHRMQELTLPMDVDTAPVLALSR